MKLTEIKTPIRVFVLILVTKTLSEVLRFKLRKNDTLLARSPGSEKTHHLHFLPKMARISLKIASNMGSVSLLVKVFC